MLVEGQQSFLSNRHGERERERERGLSVLVGPRKQYKVLTAHCWIENDNVSKYNVR
jgi:hypothetical protein